MNIYQLLDKFREENIALSLEQERDIIAKYIHSTNQLEGNSLTLAQTKSLIEDGEISGNNLKTRDLLEQRGTYKAVLRMMKAVNDKEPLSVELIKELNWLTIGALFYDDFYFSYKEAGQKFGDFKAKNNKILLILPNGNEQFVEPLSSPNSVKTNMAMLVRQVNLSEKNSIEKASFLAQELWLHQPFIDGNKRTARLLINFLTMKEGFPLFTYEEKGAYFNDMLVTQYTQGKQGLIENFIEESLEKRMKELMNSDNNFKKITGFRFIL